MSKNEKSSFKSSISFRKTGHPMDKMGGQGWEETDVSDTLTIFDYTEARTPILVVEVKNGK